MFKAIVVFVSGIAIGAASIYFFVTNKNAIAIAAVKAPGKDTSEAKIKFPIKATLYRFEMNRGKEGKFNEWMKWHYDEHTAIIETLEREKMYFESIFTDTINQKDVLYWLTIDGEGGAPVDNSPLKIDSVHNQYMKEIIKKGSRSVFKTEFSLVPNFLEQSIAGHQANEK
ncbi:MAG: DUF6176 family protein [Ferruginibacter sp.]